MKHESLGTSVRIWTFFQLKGPTTVAWTLEFIPCTCTSTDGNEQREQLKGIIDVHDTYSVRILCQNLHNIYIYTCTCTYKDKMIDFCTTIYMHLACFPSIDANEHCEQQINAHDRYMPSMINLHNIHCTYMYKDTMFQLLHN